MKLWFHILRELLVGFSFTVGGMLVLALPAIAVSAIHKLGGADLRSVLMYMPLVLAGLVPYVLPLGFLLSVVATFGRLAADNEWTALRMAGWHPLWTFTPGLLMGGVLSLATSWLVSEALPEIRRRQSVYLIETTRETLRRPAPGRTEFRLGDFYLNARRRDGPAFLDATVYIPPLGDDPARHVRAEWVEFRVDEQSVYVLLRNARTVLGDSVVQGDPTLRFDLEDLQDQDEKRYRNLRYRTTGEIRTELAAGTATAERAALLSYELNARHALSTTFLVFLLLGAPTGIMLRRGTQLGALSVAVGYALLFYLLHMRLTRQLAENHVLPPHVSAWAVIVLGLLAGLWMTRKVVRQ